MPRKFNVTYQIVTEESAAAGEADEYGHIVEEVTLKEAIDEVNRTRTNLVDGVVAIELDACPTDRPRLITITNGPEFRTGSVESRTLRIPDTVTDASARRIARLLGVNPSDLDVPISPERVPSAAIDKVAYPPHYGSCGSCENFQPPDQGDVRRYEHWRITQTGRRVREPTGYCTNVFWGEGLMPVCQARRATDAGCRNYRLKAKSVDDVVNSAPFGSVDAVEGDSDAE